MESLLCARVADNLSSGLPRHDPNQELMAQGVANFITPFFGGIPATGTIARTVTNVRAGRPQRRWPASCMRWCCWRSCWLAAPLAAQHPARRAWRASCCTSRGTWASGASSPGLQALSDVLTGWSLLGTFVLTVVFDLTVAVEMGLVLACGFFIWRMGTLFRVTPHPGGELQPGVQVFELFGSLFFGAVGKIEALPAQIPEGTRAVVLEMHRLISLDTSGLDALEQLNHSLQRRQIGLVLANVNEQPLGLMRRSGFEAVLGAEHIVPTVADALRDAAGPSDPSR